MTYKDAPNEAYVIRTDTQSFFITLSYLRVHAKEDNNVSTALRNGQFLSILSFDFISDWSAPLFCSSVGETEVVLVERGSDRGSERGNHSEDRPLIEIFVRDLINWDKEDSDRTDGSILQ